MCELCEDCDKGKLEKGKCVCQSENRKPNIKGMCGYCFVEGCAKCSLLSDRCEQCIDEEAELNEDGKCGCPNGFNEDKTCKKVSSSNCLEDEVLVDG